MMRKFFQIQNNIVIEYYSKRTFIRERTLFHNLLEIDWFVETNFRDQALWLYTHVVIYNQTA